MKKAFLWILIIATFLGCQQEKNETASIYNFFPEDAHVVFKITHFSQLKNELKENLFLNQFSSSEIYSSIENYLEPLDLIQTESESLLALKAGDEGETEFVFTTPFRADLMNLDQLKDKVIEQEIKDSGEYTKYTLENNTFYTSLKDSFLIVASSDKLIEQVLENAGQARQKAETRRLFDTANSDKTASLFINSRKNEFFGQEALKDDSPLYPQNLSEWLYMDLDSRQDLLMLNGMSIPSDTSKSLLHLFDSIPPQKSKTPSFAPANSDAILAFSFGDYPLFSENRKNLLGNSIASDSIFNTVEEIGHIYKEGKKAILVHTYGSEDLSDYLKSLRTKAISYQGNEISTLKTSTFLNAFFHPVVQNFDARFYALLENTFVFSTDLELLQNILRSYASGNTFITSQAFKSISESLTDESNLLFVSRASGLQTALKEELSDQLLSDLKTTKAASFVYGAQVIADRHFYHTHLLVQQIGAAAENKTVSSGFSVKLDAALASNPQFVVNHNTNKKEIVVQDENNALYLISNEGDILWKKSLDSRIQGKVLQVDLYKNGKQQLAFTTNEEFIILDRNGKVVEPFSKKYAGGNLNPLAVFDYDKTKNYRFVVTQGSKVFMYNSKGNIVSGFTYTEAESPILSEPKHIRIAKKDYLVFRLENGRLLILNRVGKVRIEVNKTIDFSENGVFLYKNKFITTDKKGVLFSVDQRGRITQAPLNLVADHGIDATIKTLAVMNDNILTIKGKKVSLDLGVYTEPQIFYLYDKIYVSVTDLQSEKVYLFDSQAKPIAAFPVFGASKIDLNDMDNDGKPEIVTKEGKDKILVYSLN